VSLILSLNVPYFKPGEEQMRTINRFLDFTARRAKIQLSEYFDEALNAGDSITISPQVHSVSIRCHVTSPADSRLGRPFRVMSLKSSRSFAPPPKIPCGDPSIPPDGTLFFDNGINLEFRRYSEEPTDEGQSETQYVRFRIITHPTSVRFEIMDDNQLYFLIASVLDVPKFDILHREKHLSISFSDFPVEVKRLLTESMNTDPTLTVQYVDEADGKGSLLFTQSLNLKSVEILKLEFAPAEAALIDAQVQYRFQKLAYDLYRRKLLISEFKKQMQARNPVLLRVICSPSKAMESK
jgi:hypothetical protein